MRKLSMFEKIFFYILIPILDITLIMIAFSRNSL